MNKSVCYCLTRNIYERVLPSIHSLTANNKIDRIYLLIEDDEFPYPLPDNAHIINVINQPYFRPDGPNYAQKWTYMVLMRAALTKYLVREDRVLSLDVDTIIRGDISALWDYDLTGYYLAGVAEPYWTEKHGRLYVNMGSVMFNLKALRKDGIDDAMILALDTIPFNLCEQDCINRFCAGRILELPGDYNATRWTTPTDNVLIRHYAAEFGWFDTKEVQKWLKES